MLLDRAQAQRIHEGSDSESREQNPVAADVRR